MVEPFQHIIMMEIFKERQKKQTAALYEIIY